jgi:hypothetical protein
MTPIVKEWNTGPGRYDFIVAGIEYIGQSALLNSNLVVRPCLEALQR